MRREPFVNERIVSAHQIHDIPVVVDDAFYKHFHFAAKSLPQTLIELWEQHRIRIDLVEITNLEPLKREIRHKCLRSWVGEHPLDLLFKNNGIAQFLLRRQVE